MVMACGIRNSQAPGHEEYEQARLERLKAKGLGNEWQSIQEVKWHMANVCAAYNGECMKS